MTTCTILCGLPGSGKTTLARTIPGMRLNLDDLRDMVGMTRETWTREQEDVVIRMMLESAKAAIKAGFDVVLTNTHLVPRIPRMYRKELGSLGVDFVVHDLTDVPIEECIKRDAEREKPVGKDVICKMAQRMTGWKLTAEWLTPTRAQPPDPYVPHSWLPLAVIVDIDGTIALHGNERGHYEYENVLDDVPNSDVIALIDCLVYTYQLLFVSGREARCRADTEEWILRYLGFHPRHLFMRQTGDHRPDYIVKAELFDQHIRDRYNVRFVLDDRDQVVKMWRQMGLMCLQVAEGDF